MKAKNSNLTAEAFEELCGGSIQASRVSQDMLDVVGKIKKSEAKRLLETPASEWWMESSVTMIEDAIAGCRDRHVQAILTVATTWGNNWRFEARCSGGSTHPVLIMEVSSAWGFSYEEGVEFLRVEEAQERYPGIDTHGIRNPPRVSIESIPSEILAKEGCEAVDFTSLVEGAKIKEMCCNGPAKYLELPGMSVADRIPLWKIDGDMTGIRHIRTSLPGESFDRAMLI